MIDTSCGCLWITTFLFILTGVCGTMAEGTMAKGTMAEGTMAEGTMSEGTMSEGKMAEGAMAEGTVAKELADDLQKLALQEDSTSADGKLQDRNMRLGHDVITQIFCQSSIYEN